MGLVKNWYNDIDEVVAFARWYWQGPLLSPRGVAGEIIDYFEQPWHFTPEYEAWKADDEG